MCSKLDKIIEKNYLKNDYTATINVKQLKVETIQWQPLNYML